MFTKQPQDKDTSSDETFAEYLTYLLNPTDTDELIIPHVNREIKGLNAGKAAGVDGIPPGIFKILPIAWICFITLLLNLVFMGIYSGAWCLAKVFTIFKKGVRSLSSNCRGISILSALCKLYDCVLNICFTLWYRPYTEQAGAEEGRGCPEQLLLLCLIIDIARKTGNTLYILFVDFEKAYDKVSHQKLLTLLPEQGCGAQFLSAIANTLKETDNIIGSKSFKATAGVHQGGATSCSLFTFYVNAIIRKVTKFGPDGFLYMVHLLMLMDDTVIFATSRWAMEKKLVLPMETTVPLHMSYVFPPIELRCTI